MTRLAPGPTRLLIRPAHEKNESLRGYVSRVSSRNGSSPQLNSMLVSLKATSNAIQEVATLTDCSVSILKQHGSLIQAQHNKQPGVQFGRCILSADQVWLQRRMVCPKCLANNDVSICCWEIRTMTYVTSMAAIWLIVAVAAIGGITWTSTTSEKCLCGFRLADIKTELASTDRRSICKLIADAMSKSTTRSSHSEIVSDSLAPLNWLFIASNFVLSILIPGFCQEHLGKICAINNQTSEELHLVLLKDSEYYSQLNEYISLHTFRNQMPMSRAFRAGIFDNEMRDSFLSLYKTMPLHDHLFKIKSDVLKKRELSRQQTSKLVSRAKAHRSEFLSFQL